MGTPTVLMKCGRERNLSDFCFAKASSPWEGEPIPPHQSASPPASPQGEAFDRQNPTVQHLKWILLTNGSSPAFFTQGCFLVYIIQKPQVTSIIRIRTRMPWT